MNYNKQNKYIIHHGDCLDVMALMDANSIDSIVTDPPAGISFMNKNWDKDKGGRQNWVNWMQGIAYECLRVIKPGGHAIVWAIPRTSHWTGTAWEMAGWEVRDKIYYAFGSGFPKSLNIGKAVDKAFGVEREIIGSRIADDIRSGNFKNEEKKTHVIAITKGKSQYEGFGTALKPSVEEWWLFRKPIEGTVADNVLKWGCGGLNIDGCRIGSDKRAYKGSGNQPNKINNHCKGDTGIGYMDGRGKDMVFDTIGRYPSHLILDGSDEVVGLFPGSKGMSGGGAKDNVKKDDWAVQQFNRKIVKDEWIRSDSGSAARFFYHAKASKRDREEGLEGFESITSMRYGTRKQGPLPQQTPQETVPQKNHHPTVKSTELMAYLCRLITPPNGLILDPFCGSGSTGKAAIKEGFNFIGIEKEKEYVEISKARIEYVLNNKKHEQINLI